MATHRRVMPPLAVSALAATLLPVLMPGLTASATAKRVELTVAFWGAASEVKDIWQPIKARFEKANPGVSIKLVPDITPERVVVMTAGGKAPDVFMCNYDTAVEFGLRGLVTELTPYAKRDKAFRMGDYERVAMDSYTYSGHVYGLSSHYQTTGVWYNKEYFAKAGLANPVDGWTWNDMGMAAQKISAKDPASGRKGVVGISFTSGLQFFLPYIHSAGGTVVDNIESPTRITLDNPGTRTALAWIVDMVGLGKASLGQGDEFYAGKSAMYPYYPVGQRMTSLGKRLQVDAVRLPEGPKGSRNQMWPGGFAMGKGSRNPETAWRFISFLVSTGAFNGNTIPSNIPFVESGRWPVEGIRRFNTKAFTSAAPTAMAPMKVPSQDTIIAAIDVELNKVFAGNKSLEQALQDGGNAANKVLKPILDRMKRYRK